LSFAKELEAMQVALLASAWGNRPATLRSFENWLLCWLLLPNAGYWLLWIIGAPPRALEILLTGAVGLFVNRAPFPVKFTAFLAIVAFGAAFFVSSLFNLSVVSVLYSLKFASELSPSASIEYLFCCIAVAATIAAAWYLLQRPTELKLPTRYAAAAALTVLFAWVDVQMSAGSVGSYDRTPEAGAPFTSAVGKSGFAGFATGERHLLLVMVEAMGQPKDPAIRRRLVDQWATPAVRARYDVTIGDTLFYGSTTAGEMRELCGRWADYRELLGRRTIDGSCLPARLVASGYDTRAWHSFKGSFFERTRWYPTIGFKEMRWGPEMVRKGAQRCPGVFAGACDRDVPRQIAAELKAARRPQFLYWLTVNSHLPVVEDARLRTDDCRSFDARLANEHAMTCRLLQLFADAGRALSETISAPDFPATDILIVGDHLPPFFERKNREQFEPDRVGWILLRPKSSVES
jgi:hypothetical protein